jgi:hypothetical protein
MWDPASLRPRIAALRVPAWALSAAAGMAGTVLTFYPGYLDSDTDWQLEQARSGFFDDWHPPAMAWVWRQMLPLIDGPGGPFLLNSAMFWVGFALLMHSSVRRPRLATALTLLIGWAPWNSAVLALVWKDAAFGAAMTLGFGLLSRGGRATAAAALLPFTYAALVRHNGVAAFFPAATLVAWRALGELTLGGSPRRHAVRSLALGLVITLGVAVLSGGLSRELLAGKRTFAGQVLLVFDLGGISVASGVNLFPPAYAVDLQDLRAIHQPHSVFPLLWGPSGGSQRRPGFIDGNPSRVFPLKAHWLAAILQFPRAYLVHRFEFFTRFLGIGIGRERGGFGFESSKWQHEFEGRWQRTGWNATVRRLIDRWQETFPFRTVTHLFLLLAASGIWLFRARSRAEIPDPDAPLDAALLVSGGFYLLSFLVAGVASDFRYAWWTVIAAAVLLVRQGAALLRERGLRLPWAARTPPSVE